MSTSNMIWKNCGYCPQWNYIGNEEKYPSNDISKQNGLLTYLGANLNFVDVHCWNLIAAKKEVQPLTSRAYFISKCISVCGTKKALVKLGDFFCVKISHMIFVRFIWKFLIICCENSDWSEFASNDFLRSFDLPRTNPPKFVSLLLENLFKCVFAVRSYKI